MFSLSRKHACLILILFVPVAAASDQSKKLSSETLHNDQLAVGGRYDRFERLLSQMADILGHEDPERAELLRRAISKGREKAISEQLSLIADDLVEKDLGPALEKQDDVIASLGALLQLLQSEDRRSELEKERERLNRLLKDVSNTLSEQRSARARTQNSRAPSSAAPGQQKAIQRADEILDDIRAHDPASDEDSEAESSESDSDSSGSSADSATEDGEPSDKSSKSTDPDEDSGGQDSDENSSDERQTENGRSQEQNAENRPSQNPQSPNSPSENSQSQNAPSQNSQSQNSQSQNPQSQSSQSQSSQSQSQSEERSPTPGREQIEDARRMMQQALEKLQEQLRDEALNQQDSAIEALQQAIEELRQRLLQLREEEKEMVLASLEARFQRMLAAQTQIYDETVDLDATPVEEWLDTMFTRSREVAQQQTEIKVECDQTLGLLKEDGTSVAIVLSVEDISIDMQSVRERLRASKTGTLTQTLETDIIDSLKELIEATQREMQEMKSEERQQQSPSGDQKKRALVELMAEIKVLRSLQLRVNRRTLRIDGLMAEQDNDDREELLRQLEELTARQQRLVESAEELGERLAQPNR